MSTRKTHREITPLVKEDSFLVFERTKSQFDFPIHFHPEYEINFILNAEGARRVVGDSLEVIDDVELVMVGPYLEHGWETYQCQSKEIKEVTIQFNYDLFDSKLLSRSIFHSIKNLFDRSYHGIKFSRTTGIEMKQRILSLSKIDRIDYFLSLISILQDLSSARKQRLLSSYVSRNTEFENSDRLKLLYDYIQDNYHRKITLKEISELVNMSLVSFNRFIKKRKREIYIPSLSLWSVSLQ